MEQLIQAAAVVVHLVVLLWALLTVDQVVAAL
jgi:hypothetical protein